MEPMKLKKSNRTSQRPARHTQSGPHTPSVPEDLHERITKRAHEIYERRIREAAFDDWLQAEQEILIEERKKLKAD